MGPAEHRAPDSALRMLVTLLMVLMVLNVSISMMHAMLTAAFVALPLMLMRHSGMALDHQWELYLPVMLVSAVIMGGVPLVP